MTASLHLTGPTGPVMKGDKANFVVTLSEPMKTAERVSMTTAPGTAIYGVDYFAPVKTELLFSPGQTQQTFSVSTLRSNHLGPETFQVVASAVNPSLGSRSATVSLIDYVAPSPAVSVTVDSATVPAGSAATFTVSLSTQAKTAVTVSYATADGTGVAGTDYVAASGVITFKKGETTKTVSVKTMPLSASAPDKTFSLSLSSPTGATLGSASVTETIRNTNPAPPIPSPLAGTYSPGQIRRAYGFDLFAGDGTGTTIAIVTAYNAPTIKTDLAAFDKQFNIPAPPAFTIVNQTGGSQLPANNATWAGETTLDVEWAHAIAPGAKILLVEANSPSYADFYAAWDYARNAPGVVVVSTSVGSAEYPGEQSLDSLFTTPAGHIGVSFCFPAGDNGDTEYPASSPNVLAVAGTQLTIDSQGNYVSEKVWNDGYIATGGGLSQYVPRPSFQNGVQSTVGNARGAADVAFSARDFPVYQTYGNPSAGSNPWLAVAGTSASCPVWAGLLAIADGKRLAAGKDSLANAQVAMYTLPASDFNDITVGNNAYAGGNGYPSNNGGYPAKPGYDLVSGLGTPKANLVLRDLVAFNGSTQFQYSPQPSVRPNPMIGLLRLRPLHAASTPVVNETTGPTAPADVRVLPNPGTTAGGRQSPVVQPAATGAHATAAQGVRPITTRLSPSAQRATSAAFASLAHDRLASGNG